jgi:hypothetical protein
VTQRLVRRLLLTALVIALPAAAQASACDKDVVVPIRMAPGQACWAYRGAATTFVGDFSNGKRVLVEMRGLMTEYEPRSGASETFWRARDPNVEGPGGFFFGDAEAPGELTFVTPVHGTYRFSFSPCAMWGAPGMVKICAR